MVRTVKNTPKKEYNCGGYALGTFDWFMPAQDDLDYFDLMYGGTEKEILESSIEYILMHFPYLRVIDSHIIKETKNPIIGFGIAVNYDFHFIKRGRNFQWYHKIGSKREIKRFKEDIFGTWCGVYDSKKVWFEDTRAR